MIHQWRILILLAIGLTPINFVSAQEVVETSALEYMQIERQFVSDYVLDEDGGFVFWVERDGTIVDNRKFSLVQANVIFWLGGLESQDPDPQNLELMRSAADFLLAHLYAGDGYWYDVYNPLTLERTPFFWNPSSETYIAHALFEAYQFLGDEKYLRSGQETTARQRLLASNGQVLREGTLEDIGFRFPEQMGHFEEYTLTGSPQALTFVRAFDRVYRDRFAQEQIENIFGKQWYLHGVAIIDKLLYAMEDGNEEAFAEGTHLRELYWRIGHDDAKVFTNDRLGEVADNGRDYYDKRLAMDLIEWSYDGGEDFQADAKEMWRNIKRFWDPQTPYGFLVNTAQLRKTCFSINQPGLMIDLTEPVILAVEDRKSWLWNHQLSLLVQDPRYRWNHHTLKGIGIDPESLDMFIPWGFSYGLVDAIPGPCENCYRLKTNYLSFSGRTPVVTISDWFANRFELSLDREDVHPVDSLWGLNRNSLLYYTTLFGVIWAFLVPIIFAASRVARRMRDED